MNIVRNKLNANPSINNNAQESENKYKLKSIILVKLICYFIYKITHYTFIGIIIISK